MFSSVLGFMLFAAIALVSLWEAKKLFPAVNEKATQHIKILKVELSIFYQPSSIFVKFLLLLIISIISLFLILSFLHEAILISKEVRNVVTWIILALGFVASCFYLWEICQVIIKNVWMRFIGKCLFAFIYFLSWQISSIFLHFYIRRITETEPEFFSSFLNLFIPILSSFIFILIILLGLYLLNSILLCLIVILEYLNSMFSISLLKFKINNEEYQDKKPKNKIQDKKNLLGIFLEMVDFILKHFYFLLPLFPLIILLNIFPKVEKMNIGKQLLIMTSYYSNYDCINLPKKIQIVKIENNYVSVEAKAANGNIFFTKEKCNIKDDLDD